MKNQMQQALARASEEKRAQSYATYLPRIRQIATNIASGYVTERDARIAVRCWPNSPSVDKVSFIKTETGCFYVFGIYQGEVEPSSDYHHAALTVKEANIMRSFHLMRTKMQDSLHKAGIKREDK